MTTLTRLSTLLAVSLSIGACSPTEPGGLPRQPDSGPPTTENLGTIRVQGTVRNTAFRPVSDALIEALDGPSVVATTKSDENGRFELAAVAPSMAIRASGPGYELTAVKSPTWGLEFVLQATAPAVNLDGDYTLTFIAAETCGQLPEEARRRSYSATIHWFGSVTGATFRDGLSEFATYRSGNEVTFSTEFDGLPWIMEEIEGGGHIAFHGTGWTIVETPISTIAVPFSGYIEYCASTGCGQRSRCVSPNHQFILTRR